MLSTTHRHTLRSVSDGSGFLRGKALQLSTNHSYGRQRSSHFVKRRIKAYKKKGQSLYRRGPGNSVIRRGRPAVQKPPKLPVDPQNEEFIIFVRSARVPRWLPYTVMKGGWSANALARAQDTKIGRNLYGNALIKNVAQALYKDINKIEMSIRENISVLKAARTLEYGFKIRDKENPDDWYKTEGVQLLPPKEEVEEGGMLDNVKDFFTGKKKLF